MYNEKIELAVFLMNYRLILSWTFLNLLSYKTYSAKHNSIGHKQKAEMRKKKKTFFFVIYL